MSSGRHEPHPPGGEPFLGAGEDAGDAVGLGEEGGVDHGEGESRQETRECAGDGSGSRQDGERGGVRDSHAGQDQVAEFSCGGLDDGRVVVSEEHAGRQERTQEAEAREGEGHDCLRVCPLHELYWDLVAHYNTPSTRTLLYVEIH